MKNIGTSRVIMLWLSALMLGAAVGFAYSLTAQTTAARTPELNMVVATVIGNLQREEGFSAKPYTDTRGCLTIGYGTAICEGITRTEAVYLLRERLIDTRARLASEWQPFKTMSSPVRVALLDMGYQLGVEGLLEFHDMLAALARGDLDGAVAAGKASDWYQETPKRAKRVLGALGG